MAAHVRSSHVPGGRGEVLRREGGVTIILHAKGVRRVPTSTCVDVPAAVNTNRRRVSLNIPGAGNLASARGDAIQGTGRPGGA